MLQLERRAGVIHVVLRAGMIPDFAPLLDDQVRKKPLSPE
jgi:hypothetical protein